MLILHTETGQGVRYHRLMMNKVLRALGVLFVGLALAVPVGMLVQLREGKVICVDLGLDDIPYPYCAGPGMP